jgi:hypothetical protein
MSYNEQETIYNFTKPVLHQIGNDDPQGIKFEIPSPVEPTGLKAVAADVKCNRSKRVWERKGNE